MNEADPQQTHLATDWTYASPLIACRIDPRSKYLFAGAQDCTLQRFDMATGKPTACPGHDSWVRAIAFSPDGKFTYTGGYDGLLICQETAAETPQPARTTPAHDGWVRSVAVSPDGKLLATCGNDNLIKLWNAADGKLVRELAGHAAHVYNVAFHPAGGDLVSFDLMGVAKHWTLADGKENREFKIEALHKFDNTFQADIGGARSIGFNEDGSRLAIGGITEVSNAFAGIGVAAVAVLDWDSGKQVQFHRPKAELRGATWGLAYHPQGFLIAAAGGGSGGFLYFYKEEEVNPFHELKLPGSARDMSLHPDQLQVAVPFFDGHARLFRMEKKPEPPKKEAPSKDAKKADGKK